MNEPILDRPGGASWSVAEISYDRLDRRKVADDQQLLYMLAAASFVEITSDLYTRNLADYYRGDAEVTEWLANQWEVEELQHGKALKRYVAAAWPEFDWEAAYRSFLAEYSCSCTMEELAETRALEMAARCVIETGTATFYRALSDLTSEPLLRRITANIAADEVRHYKYFYRFFQKYQAVEHPRRAAVMRMLWRRGVEIEAKDAYIAFKHVFLQMNPGAQFSDRDYQTFVAAARALAQRHFPYAMAVKMMAKPLDLGPMLGRLLLPPMVGVARLLLLR